MGGLRTAKQALVANQSSRHLEGVFVVRLVPLVDALTEITTEKRLSAANTSSADE